jgi:ubiquinone/menaquinone biosynthesis C-methylase UbiE
MESAASPASEQPQIPPQAVLAQMAMGAWVSKAISDISRLGIPDVVKKHGALTAAEMVAHGIGAKVDALERGLRACASLGVFTESADGRFGATELSNAMASDTPGSVKGFVELISGPAWKTWGGLKVAMQTGEPQARNTLGMEFWDYLNANPKQLEEFGEAMKANSHSSMSGVLKFCDLSGATKVADIAGGFGHLAIALLEKYPKLTGVLLDAPSVIALAKQKLPAPEGVAPRLEYVGGNMFESVPAADVYIMKHIIHDWDDARCLQLLKNCREAMQGAGRVICVDAVLPPMGDTGNVSAKMLDLTMLVTIPGKERTQAQWEDLYTRAGLRVTSITPLQDNFGTSIIEGVKA